MTPREAFAEQAIACEMLGSPFMGRLMTLCADRLDDSTAIGRQVLNWHGNPHHSADSVPLRLAGGLHRLVLERPDSALAASYPPHDVSDDDLWSAVENALASEKEALERALAFAPQTNEVRRSVALIPALHLIAAQTGLPLRLSELGASAGLNLNCGLFHLTAGSTEFGPPDSSVRLAPDWKGTPPSPTELTISDRAGVDINPVMASDANDRTRLLSYLWPDQFERIARTIAALDLALANPYELDQADAIDWLDDRLKTQADGETHVVYSTVAWQYFPKEAQERGLHLMAETGAQATARRPLAHLMMEADGGRGAALTLRLWPNGETLNLARVDFHGRWIEWTTT